MVPAQATCLFAKDTPPQGWYEWAAVLVAGDVTQVEQRGHIDVVSLAESDTFKGPANVKTATLDVPTKLWGVCKIAPNQPCVAGHQSQRSRRMLGAGIRSPGSPPIVCWSLIEPKKVCW